MLFNSYEFIFLFLPISFSVYFYLNNKKLTTASKTWLVFTSLFFYSWWNIIYLPLILISILFNYNITNQIIKLSLLPKKDHSKKQLLQLGLVFNIGLLIYFKYMDFFIENTNHVLGVNINLLHMALPLAISFFTLQQVAFLIDSYEGLVKEKDLLNYTLFVTFFPQLIAGPIVHHKEMMPQFAGIKNKILNYVNISTGMYIFSIGLFKKVILADTFALWSNTGFDVATNLNFLESWSTSLTYTFQLYFDFSGYTDMAVGTALLFNIKLPHNFNSPYKATGMIDFWQRWHITLSTFITVYIYTPLVRSYRKLTFNKAMLATFITFFIAGLWHGASWMFIIFGSLHGLGLITNHYWKKTKLKLHPFLAWLITFNFVNISFIFFRAKDWETAIKVCKGMVNLNNLVLPMSLTTKIKFLNPYSNNFSGFLENIHGSRDTIFLLLFAFVLILMFKNSTQKSLAFKPRLYHSIFMTAIFVFSILLLNRRSQFLYFNF